jgi:ribosome-binding protein aMBF1 (putative translation factor)
MTMPWLARNFRVGTRRAAMGRKKKGPAEGVSPRARQFAEHLDALLLEKGLSAAELATRLGLSPVTVYSYLQGRSMPAVRELPLLRESLKLNSCAELLPRDYDLPEDEGEKTKQAGRQVL